MLWNSKKWYLLSYIFTQMIFVTSNILVFYLESKFNKKIYFYIFSVFV